MMILFLIPTAIVMGICCGFLLTQMFYNGSNSYGDQTGSFEHFTGGSQQVHYIDKKTLTYKEFKELK